MSKPSPTLAFYAVLVLLAALCATGLWRVMAMLGAHVPLDPNEGWNAYHAAAAISGEPLYPGHQAYLVNNYPPLSFYVVGLAGRMVGDAIVAGRMVSLAGLAAIAAAMTAVARRFGAGRGASLLAMLLFVGGLLTFTDYVGMDDPQMLAEALSLAGLLVLLRWKQTWPAAALFVAGFFVKHNVVALPIAATLWLIFEDRRRGRQLAGFELLFGLAGLVLFHLAYGVGLMSAIVTARSYSLDALVTGLVAWLQFALLPIAGLVMLALLSPRAAAVRFCLFYAAIAGAIGVYFLGGAGVDVNVLFDADIALCLSAALLLQRLRTWWRPAWAGALVAPLLLFSLADADWRDANLDPAAWREDAATARDDVAFLAGHPGPAMCEMLAFCYWAGKPPAVDEFNVGQQFETGARSDAEIVRLVEEKRFAVLQFDPGEPTALGDNVARALQHAYRLHHRDGFGTFYVPK